MVSSGGAQKFVKMMGRQLVFAFAYHLVACYSLLIEPNYVRHETMLNVKNPPLLPGPGASKIIGGLPTDIENYPYVVSLQNNGTTFGHEFEHFCVGNIVSDKWILTAAKCAYGKQPDEFHVRVGSDLYYEGGRIHQIQSIEIHPEYDNNTWDYDVGLLKLSEGIIFSEKAKPVILPETGLTIENGTLLDIVGWGATQLLKPPSDKINHNTIPTISQEECKEVNKKNLLTDRMFCVFSRGNGPCIGDTGSPGVLDGVLIGVASWSQSCAYKYPTAYARLPEMVDWIIKVTRNSSSESSRANGIPDTACASALLIAFGMFATL